MQKKYFFFIYFIIFIFITSISNASDIFAKGREIFLNKGNCMTCHTLSEAKSTGMIGPNLNELRPDKEKVIIVVTNGIGVMPSYQGELTKEEIESVALYVSEASTQ